MQLVRLQRLDDLQQSFALRVGEANKVHLLQARIRRLTDCLHSYPYDLGQRAAATEDAGRQKREGDGCYWPMVVRQLHASCIRLPELRITTAQVFAKVAASDVVWSDGVDAPLGAEPAAARQLRVTSLATLGLCCSSLERRQRLPRPE